MKTSIFEEKLPDTHRRLCCLDETFIIKRVFVGWSA